MLTAPKHRVKSLNTGVYDRLKEMIARREIQPGARLVQQTLARSMGTSPMPVIEALRRLERDGLVTHVPHLGSFVRESGPEEVSEMYCIRRGLEAEACRLFVHRATPAQKRKLMELNDQLNAAARDGDIGSFIQLDMAFHMHIVDAAGVPRLKELLESRQIEERIFQNAPELKAGSGTSRLLGAHDAATAALLGGDEDAAADAIRRHILEAEHSYLEAARAGGGGNSP